MKQVSLEIVSNEEVGKNIYLMKLKGDLSAIQNPGEFVELKLPNYYLRRPISVCRHSSTTMDLLYKVLGRGTKEMTSYSSGARLDCLIGLGNGFDTTKSKKPLLIAGGIGIAPMLGLAERFNAEGITPIILYGASTKTDFALLEELEKLGELHLCTDDGSLGFKGNPIQYLKTYSLSFDCYYACGPQALLKHLKNYQENGYLSLEARMGCGFGACMGCSIQTIHGPKRVCKQGPVFEASEVIF